MKLRLHISLKLLAAMVLVTFLGTSCTKEDVSPCSRHSEQEASGQAKNDKPNSNSGDHNGIVVGTTGLDNGISDDGDDLSDSERSRKKPRN